jgi:hypothetical protein
MPPHGRPGAAGLPPLIPHNAPETSRPADVSTNSQLDRPTIAGANQAAGPGRPSLSRSRQQRAPSQPKLASPRHRAGAECAPPARGRAGREVLTLSAKTMKPNGKGQPSIAPSLIPVLNTRSEC